MKKKQFKLLHLTLNLAILINLVVLFAVDIKKKKERAKAKLMVFMAHLPAEFLIFVTV